MVTKWLCLQTLAANLFASSIVPYAGFLWHLQRSKQAPKLTMFGFYWLLVFVAVTIPAGIICEPPAHLACLPMPCLLLKLSIGGGCGLAGVKADKHKWVQPRSSTTLPSPMWTTYMAAQSPCSPSPTCSLVSFDVQQCVRARNILTGRLQEGTCMLNQSYTLAPDWKCIWQWHASIISML